MIRLGLVGDVMLGRNVDAAQQYRDPEHVWGSVLDRLQGLDGLLINLETTLSTRGTRWTATYRPFHFRADPGWAVPALERAGVDYCSLANNHLMDYREPALVDTLDHLDGAGIARAGAGRNLDEARRPARFAVGDLDVACIAFTDNTPEFAADFDSPGVAHLPDAGERSREVVRETLGRIDGKTDLLVASLHWGPNMVTEPDDDFRSFCKWLAGLGVDVVHGHSAHVFQGVEVHDGALLCYDMGDFVDDYRVDRTLRNDRSFLFEVGVKDGAVVELRLLPVEIYDYSVHEAGPEAARWCRQRMRGLSAAFGTGFERDGEELVVGV